MVSYDNIFSSFNRIVDNSKELAILSDKDLRGLYTERLHSVLSDNRVLSLFSSINFDDSDCNVSYSLSKPSQSSSIDDIYVIEILSLGMAIDWYSSRINNAIWGEMYWGGKEEKKIYGDPNALRTVRDGLEVKLKKKVRDRGYYLGVL